jgi:hypothetical protein
VAILRRLDWVGSSRVRPHLKRNYVGPNPTAAQCRPAAVAVAHYPKPVGGKRGISVAKAKAARAGPPPASSSRPKLAHFDVQAREIKRGELGAGAGLEQHGTQWPVAPDGDCGDAVRQRRGEQLAATQGTQRVPTNGPEDLVAAAHLPIVRHNRDVGERVLRGRKVSDRYLRASSSRGSCQRRV